jgi:protein-S-isoprenylcysteine O-methyltransferase Ste14
VIADVTPRARQPAPTPDLTPAVQEGVRRWAAKTALFIVVMALVMFGVAGTTRWPGGWLYLAVVAGNLLLLAGLLYRRNPALLAERSAPRQGAKAWDPPLALTVAVAGPSATVLVAALDVRYDWIGYVPPELVRAALALALGGGLLTTWAMVANPFFSSLVHIGTERGHHVVTQGPYRLVRHPGYLGGIIFALASPYLLGSRWAVFASWAVAAAFILRTWLEDRALRAELPGYSEYAARTRYRLLPWVW